MNFKLVADSCCDMTKDLREKLGLVSVPLKMTFGDETFVDDQTLDRERYLKKMNEHRGKSISACPSPGEYCDAFLGANFTFAVTLSSNLSASYSSAMSGKMLAEEKGTSVHVFDSKSASAGELLIALKIKALIDKGKETLDIIEQIGSFIKSMKTFFVLDNLENLVKNGRMNKVVGHIATILNLKPILGADEDGNIAVFSKVRGAKQAIEKLSETIRESGKSTEGETAVICHCNNPENANQLKSLIGSKYKFKDIHIVPTGGLSSMYAGIGGVILAF